MIEAQATSFWRASIESILQTGSTPLIEGAQGEWSRRAVVYNLFVRSSCAFDHDGNGEVSVLNRQGLRETGTILKAITLLPYIRALGCNVVHLLPINRIGLDGRKGSLGSPYAVANPYQLDETLSEPLVGLGPEAEFKAFVEAAHRLGIRVVLEFVFRTAARDSEWVHQHPDWFYWIHADVPDRQKGLAVAIDLRYDRRARLNAPRREPVRFSVQRSALIAIDDVLAGAAAEDVDMAVAVEIEGQRNVRPASGG